MYAGYALFWKLWACKSLKLSSSNHTVHFFCPRGKNFLTPCDVTPRNCVTPFLPGPNTLAMQPIEVSKRANSATRCDDYVTAFLWIAGGRMGRSVFSQLRLKWSQLRCFRRFAMRFAQDGPFMSIDQLERILTLNWPSGIKGKRCRVASVSQGFSHWTDGIEC